MAAAGFSRTSPHFNRAILVNHARRSNSHIRRRRRRDADLQSPGQTERPQSGPAHEIHRHASPLGRRSQRRGDCGHRRRPCLLRRRRHQRNGARRTPHRARTKNASTGCAAPSRFPGAFTACRRSPSPASTASRWARDLGVCLACDLRIASDQAKFGTAYAKVGFGGDFGVTWLLTRYAGAPKAKELLFFAERSMRQQALRLGLLNQVVPAAIARYRNARARIARGRRAAGELSLHERQREPGDDGRLPHHAGSRAGDALALRPDRGPSRGRQSVSSKSARRNSRGDSLDDISRNSPRKRRPRRHHHDEPPGQAERVFGSDGPRNPGGAGGRARRRCGAGCDPDGRGPRLLLGRRHRPRLSVSGALPRAIAWNRCSRCARTCTRW